MAAWAAGFEGRRGHGGELGCYGEEAVEGAIWERGGDLGGDVCYDSVIKVSTGEARLAYVGIGTSSCLTAHLQLHIRRRK